MTTKNDQAVSPANHPPPKELRASPTAPHEQDSPRTLEDLMVSDEPLTRELAGIKKELVANREELARLASNEQVVTDLHQRHQVLSERFHDREVLAPIFFQLIGIADRCRQNEEHLKRGYWSYY